jgi:hypothetical protein
MAMRHLTPGRPTPGHPTPTDCPRYEAAGARALEAEAAESGPGWSRAVPELGRAGTRPVLEPGRC